MTYFLDVPDEVYEKLNRIAEVLAPFVWTGICIMGKVSIEMKKRKLSKQDLISHIIYAIIGSVMAYFGTYTLSREIRYMALGVGAISGDVFMKVAPKKSADIMDAFSDLIVRWITRKKDDK